MSKPDQPALFPAGGSVLPPVPAQRFFKFRYEIKPFGDRYRVVLADGIHEAAMIASRQDMLSLRASIDAALASGPNRAARRKARKVKP